MLGYVGTRKEYATPSPLDTLDAIAEAASDLKGLAYTLQALGECGRPVEPEQLALCGDMAQLIAEALEDAAANLVASR